MTNKNTINLLPAVVILMIIAGFLVGVYIVGKNNGAKSCIRQTIVVYQ